MKEEFFPESSPIDIKQEEEHIDVVTQCDLTGVDMTK